MSLVFFGHFASIFSYYLAPGTFSLKVLEYFATWGHRGICIFLLITGYFVYGSFLKNDPGYLPFVKKRLLRIYPLYWSILAIYLVLSLAVPAASKLPNGAVAAAIYVSANALLLQGLVNIPPMITVSWALTYLVLTYLMLPLVVKALRMGSWVPWQRILAITAGALLWLEVCQWYPFLNARVVMIAAGMLLWEAVNRPAFRSSFTLTREWMSITLFVLGLTLGYLCDKRLLEFLPRISPQNVYQFVFLSIGLFYFCAYIFAYSGILNRFFSRQPLRVLGKMSYSYYLAHGLSLKGAELVINRLASPPLHFAAAFWGILVLCYAASLCTAELIFLTIERPLARRITALSAERRVESRRLDRAMQETYSPSAMEMSSQSGLSR